ncbi:MULTISPECIES: ATP-binding cassette domain-containing protein [Leptospirillum]|jgi:ABC-2 type transport system ATP-binding protein|uniref:ATP-binding cassette domain-containing protein n=1 Tax=Leptospirillum TaxID=179 RepID=UPI0000F0C9B7|nr:MULTISPECIES: ATP-binding cassette domain-containing protein [Leptospirillum]EAY56762.1 MAG: ABC transporter ATP-binding protein [Leptospirillum rubarum]EIJ76686.1 MAG: Daunorubicin resistance ABC transporter ATP-binding subunit [Leptospirillum sp. Group II 'C75']MCL4405789.1 ATP-binding cassette domain-containing protein [Bacillota bacterium]MCL5259857.1 ATP-binding cassette domain-containing protein [Nitrospirota bacterium]AKS24025.1 ABC transporter ATP-binding protein [Leptospirillum sp.
MIEIRQLSKIFSSSGSRRVAVNKIDLSIGKGEFFALLGPNGAGKTTTISILSTILKPTSGEVKVDGLNVVDSPHLVRQKIGIIFQDPSLDDRLSALENMEFHGRLYGLSRPQRMAQSEALLKMVDLWERRQDLVRTFSGGMRRRLEIARGLMHHPKLLILDEPTIGLDPKTRRTIWEYIHLSRKQWGMTVFLTTHYLEEADSADRVGVMDEGRLVAVDTPEKLKKMVGPEVIVLQTDPDNLEPIQNYLEKFFGIVDCHVDSEGEISFPLPIGEEGAIGIIRKLPGTIRAMTIRKPDLDDVFIQMTGKNMALNQETASPFHRVYRGKL